MPYYLYRITQVGPIRQLEKIAAFDVFKQASAEAKRLRAETPPEQARIQVIYGENELQAEGTLNTVRDPQPVIGDD